MDLKSLFAAASQHYITTHPLPQPGRHSKGRTLRTKARIAKRRAKRKSA